MALDSIQQHLRSLQTSIDKLNKKIDANEMNVSLSSVVESWLGRLKTYEAELKEFRIKEQHLLAQGALFLWAVSL